MSSSESISDSTNQVSQSSKENELQAVSCSGSAFLCDGPDGAALVSLWLTRRVLSFYQRSTAADGSHCASGGASTLILRR